MNKGWFEIDGIQSGDRTLRDQMLGLDALPSIVFERTVLDLGCAEGLIAMEVALLGSALVDAVDFNHDFITTARKVAADRGISDQRLRFHEADLSVPLPTVLSAQYDVVLALAIIHKLRDMGGFLRRSVRQSKEFVVIRYPERAIDGVIQYKYNHGLKVNAPNLMRTEGFSLFARRDGPRNERVEYWRRNGDR